MLTKRPQEEKVEAEGTASAAGDDVVPIDAMGATLATGDAAIVVSDLNVEAGKLQHGGGGASGKSGAIKSSVRVS